MVSASLRKKSDICTVVGLFLKNNILLLSVQGSQMYLEQVSIRT